MAPTTGRAHPQAEAERTGFLGPPPFSLSHLKKAREKMTCHNCRIECRKFGKTRKGQQRYRCCQCYKTYSGPRNEHLGGMYTAPEKVEGVINLLVEGCSIRSIQRLTGIDQNTIMKILVLAGNRCQRLLESKCRNVPVSDVQCDEIWGFVAGAERSSAFRRSSDEGVHTQKGRIVEIIIPVARPGPLFW
jgi:transposase-like protein